MPGKFPHVPIVAKDYTYAAGPHAWSSEPTKLEAGAAGFEAQGFVPNQPPGAQAMNYVFHGQGAAVQDIQRMAAIKVVASGIDQSLPALSRILETSRRIAMHNSNAVSIHSLDRRRSVVRGATNAPVSPHLNKGAPFLGGSVILFPYNAAGGTNYNRISDSSDTVAALPGTSTRIYTHACKDSTSGNVLAVSGGSGTAADVGFARFTAGGNAFTAIAASFNAWPGAQANMACASKPNETRAFSKSHNFRSTDGGVTVSGLFITEFIGGVPVGELFPPCWDSINARWVASVTDLSANRRIYTSTDGIHWAFLANTDHSIVYIREHRGWLWAIARIQAHGGLELLFSTNGGASWNRPDIVLSYRDLGTTATAIRWYYNCCNISAHGGHILFQTTITHTPDTVAPFAANSGNGQEFVILSVDYHAP